MQWFLMYLCVPLVCSAAVNNLKSLTESMGQEVIEIDTPLKELPPEIEEEPSAEKDFEVKSVTTVQTATKDNVKKNFAAKETRHKIKDAERTHSMKQEEDEARIEKELADLYKDSADYKADSAELSKEVSETTHETTQMVVTEEDASVSDLSKSIARARNEFKFQPDSNRKADVEWFRTSVDDVQCDRKPLTGTTTEPSSSGQRHTWTGMIILTIICKNVLNL